MGTEKKSHAMRVKIKHKRILERLKNKYFLASQVLSNVQFCTTNIEQGTHIKRRGEYMYMKNVNYNFN